MKPNTPSPARPGTILTLAAALSCGLALNNLAFNPSLCHAFSALAFVLSALALRRILAGGR